jgi:hypothetical protein
LVGWITLSDHGPKGQGPTARTVESETLYGMYGPVLPG